ncbi:hypothetical protein H8957_012499 [Semnopithecus entellus]
MTSLQDGVEMWGECAGLVCEGWGHVGSMVLFVQVASGRAVSRDQFPSPPPLLMGSEGVRERPNPPSSHTLATLGIKAAQHQSMDLPTQKERGASVEGDLNDLPLKRKMSLQVGKLHCVSELKTKFADSDPTGFWLGLKTWHLAGIQLMKDHSLSSLYPSTIVQQVLHLQFGLEVAGAPGAFLNPSPLDLTLLDLSFLGGSETHL